MNPLSFIDIKERQIKMETKHKCPTCSKELTDAERIVILEQELAAVKAELAAEKAKFKYPIPNLWNPAKYGDVHSTCPPLSNVM